MNSPTPPTSEPNPAKTVPVTEAAAHYTELRAYFEKLITWTGSAALALIALATWLFYSSLNEAKKAVIEGAETTAKAEARVRVAEAFREKNIQQTIESVTKDEISSIVRSQVSAQQSEMRRQMLEITRIADLGLRTGLGVTSSSLDELRLAERSHADKMIRDYARQTREMISSDFERMITGADPGITTSADALKAKNWVGLSNDEQISPRDLAAKLYEKFRSSSHILQRAVSVYNLKVVTGRQFDLLDFEAVEQWAAAEGLRK